MFYIFPKEWSVVAERFQSMSEQWAQASEFWAFSEIEKTCKQKSAAYLTDKGCVLFLAAGQDWELLFIWVDPRERRHGIGERILRDALKSCTPTKVFLEVSATNTAAQKLYKKCGFHLTRTRQHYYRDGSDALLMEIQC